MNQTEQVLDNLVIRYPVLTGCKTDIQHAYELLETCYVHKGKLLVCGNGGSASDSEHIVGELMKGFVLPRKVEPEPLPGKKLQYGLPAVSLVSQHAIISATANDNGPELVFAQQVMGYGVQGDAFIGISTSGNSQNVVLAAELAGKLGLSTIGLTGRSGGKLRELSDCCICVPETETYKVQELHLPVYHCLCMMLEYRFFG
jgi:D-sedoheptulose 7-phosphate isomerase